MKAYRQLAMIWHPDKHEEGEEKSKAEKKFMDIADAKEVLTTPGIIHYKATFTNTVVNQHDF